MKKDRIGTYPGGYGDEGGKENVMKNIENVKLVQNLKSI